MSLLAALLSFSVVFPAQPDIAIQVTENKEKRQDLIFIAPHENESVANQYLRDKIKTEGGKFIELRQYGKRLIELKIDGNTLRVDPNRIFTPLGRRATLRKLNPNIAPNTSLFSSGLARAKQLADFLLNHLKKSSLSKTFSWIAMHNNTNGYTDDGKGGEGTISIVRYQKKLAGGSKFLIKVNRTSADEDDLFYVTDPIDFAQMKKDGWNAVLENPIVKTDINEDDGSLSVFANQSGIRYINIEAERKGTNGGNDHLKEKQRMIDYIYTIQSSSQPDLSKPSEN
jgi:hypothetical protein